MPRAGRFDYEQYQDERVVTIRPIQGQWGVDPGTEMPAGASPDMQNCAVFAGILRKRPGFMQHSTGNTAFDSEVVGIISVRDDQGNTYLYACTTTKMHRYNDSTDVWDEITGSAFTGTNENFFSLEMSQGKLCFSNGVDAVQVTALNTTTRADLNANCPPAKYLCRFNNRLNLAWTVESSAQKPFRHRRPASGDHTDWTGLGSGFRDEPEFNAYITGMKRLNANAAALYYDRMIEIVTQNPDANAPFFYSTQVPDIGLLAPRTLKGRGNIHMFLGNDDFYQFNGLQPVSIGFPERDALFYTLAIGNPHKMHSEVMFDTQEYITFLIQGDASTPNVIWVYNYGRNIWYPWRASGHMCSTKHAIAPAITIDDLTGTIDDQNWEFDAQFMSSDYPALTTGHSNGKVYRWSYEYLSDDGTAIDCLWTSQDFTPEEIFNAPGKKIEMARLECEFGAVGKACSLTVSTSIDGGNSWTSQGTLTLASFNRGIHTAHLDFRTVGDRIRFKIENNTTDESFRIYKFKPVFRLHDTVAYE